jgi:hypothetical protein
MEDSVAKLSFECQRNFVKLKEILELTDGNLEVSSRDIEDELGRFRMWASNIGAIKIGKASLDYRLREAEYLSENVKSLLRDLKGVLNEGDLASPRYVLTWQ